MQKNGIIAIVAAVIVIAAVCISAYTVLNNNNDQGNYDDTYYFYVSSDDANISGWHSSTGSNAADAFAKAMDKDKISYEFNKSGYLSKLGTHEGYFYSALYLYNNSSADAAKASITGYSGILNGWKDVAGYDKTGYTGDKLAEIDSHVFFYAMYAQDYTHATPDSDKTWSTTGPFEKETKFCDHNQTYYFYISSDDTKISGWFSATATNAADAFASAMKNAGISYEFSAGYLSSLGGHSGYWYSSQYVYSDHTQEAAKASITGYSGILNGWQDVAGYNISGYDGDKFCELEANVYFYTMYAQDYTHATPDSDKAWSTTGPFSA